MIRDLKLECNVDEIKNSGKILVFDQSRQIYHLQKDEYKNLLGNSIKQI